MVDEGLATVDDFNGAAGVVRGGGGVSAAADLIGVHGIADQAVAQLDKRDGQGGFGHAVARQQGARVKARRREFLCKGAKVVGANGFGAAPGYTPAR